MIISAVMAATAQPRQFLAHLSLTQAAEADQSILEDRIRAAQAEPAVAETEVVLLQVTPLRLLELSTPAAVAVE
jgi:predicted dinucleotide-binding enzyme